MTAPFYSPLLTQPLLRQTREHDTSTKPDSLCSTWQTDVYRVAANSLPCGVLGCYRRPHFPRI